MGFGKTAILPPDCHHAGWDNRPGCARHPQLDRLTAELDALFEKIVAAVKK